MVVKGGDSRGLKGGFKLVEETTDGFGVAEHRMERERKAEAQDGAGKEGREHSLLLPLHLESGSGQKVAGNGYEGHKTCRRQGVCEEDALLYIY